MGLSVKWVALIELKIIEIAEFLPEAYQQGLLDRVALVHKIVNLINSHSPVFLVLFNKLCNFLKKFFEFLAVDFLDFLLEEIVVDFIEEVICNFGMIC